MPLRAAWRGVLHSIGLAPLLELREIEEAKQRALEAAIHARVATAEIMAKRRREMAQVEACARDVMQRQERAEPNRDGDPHDF